MTTPDQHPWQVDESEAIAIQTRLSARVIRNDEFEEIRRIAGVDVAYDDANSKLFAAVVVFDAVSHQTLEKGKAVGRVEFPYVPGLFAFRAKRVREGLPDF